MDLREAIMEEHSKKQTNKIIRWVGNSQKKFDELVKCFLSDDKKLSQRAGWPLSYIGIAHTGLASKHLPAMLKNLRKPGLHAAVKRNTIRLLQDISIPKRLHGELMNTCFAYISSAEETVAVKAFSLTVLQNLAKQYPDIRLELKTIIEDRWDMETIAFRTRAKKVLQAFQ